MRRFARDALVSLVEDLPLFVFLAAITGVYLVVSKLYPGPGLAPVRVFRFTAQTMATVVLAVVVAYPAIRLVRRRRGGSNRLDWASYLDRYLSVRQGVGILLVIAWWTVFVAIFDTVKSYIPIVFSFRWDEAFMAADRLLHAGAHPWELLHALRGGEWATVVIDRLYVSWYPYLLVLLTVQAWNPDRQHRARFLLSFASVWFLLGIVVAMLSASAGPIFYGEVVQGGGDPYRDLLAHLEAVDRAHSLVVLDIRDQLWTNYLSRGGFGAIAAMPSVHVAVAVLGALSAQDIDGRLGLVGWLYAGVVMVGSVYLGWHYAIDGYVSLVATLVIWRLTGPAAQSYRNRIVEPAREALADRIG